MYRIFRPILCCKQVSVVSSCRHWHRWSTNLPMIPVGSRKLAKRRKLTQVGYNFLTVLLWVKRETMDWESCFNATGFPPWNILINVTSGRFLTGYRRDIFQSKQGGTIHLWVVFLWSEMRKNHPCSHMTHELSLAKNDRLIKAAEGAATLLQDWQVCLCCWWFHILWYLVIP